VKIAIAELLFEGSDWLMMFFSPCFWIFVGVGSAILASGGFARIRQTSRLAASRVCWFWGPGYRKSDSCGVIVAGFFRGPWHGLKKIRNQSGAVIAAR